MNKIVIYFLVLIPLIFFSCKKNDSKSNFSNDFNSEEKIVQEFRNETIKFEPEKSYNMDLTEYKTYGKLRPFYELGYDDNYHAYLTDEKSKIQIVFLCSSYVTDYMKEDFLNHYDEAIKENRDLENAFSYVIEWCIEKASKHEVVWSNHFNCDIERYYVPYNIAQGLFHI